MYNRNKGKTWWVPAADVLPPQCPLGEAAMSSPTKSQWDVMQSIVPPAVENAEQVNGCPVAPPVCCMQKHYKDANVIEMPSDLRVCQLG